MDERRQADLPWAQWPIALRIAAALVFAVVAALMALTLAYSRGLVAGVVIGLFWGVLEVLVIVFPTTLQRLARTQPLFAPTLTLGLLLYGLLVFTSIATSIAVFAALIISGLIAIISVQQKRRASAPRRTPTPTRGRRHS